jgi:hypothetical protein
MEREISQYQKFEPTVVNRSEINGADYNPRKISDAARKKLRENIKRVGLLDTIVVNKNTMNIVSGHQRVSILDSLERKKDYNLTVAMVDLTETEEREQNLFFNNSKAQGEYDSDLLAAMFTDFEIDFDNTGFDINDVAILGVDTDLFDTGQESQTESDKAVLKLNGEIFENKKDLRKATVGYSQGVNQDSVDTFVTLTFSTNNAKQEFLERFGFRPNERYIKGEVFSEMVERVE